MEKQNKTLLQNVLQNLNFHTPFAQKTEFENPMLKKCD